MINRRTFLRGALGGAALALGAPAIAQDRPLRLGLLAPRSGVGAFLGEDSIRAVRWGADRINRSGGIAGRRVELVVQEETTPKDTIERFRHLVLQEKVDAVHGLISTGVTLAVAPVAEDERVLLQCWDGTTQNGVQESMPKSRFVFRSTDNECEAVMAALMVIKHYKGKFVTVAGINPDYSYGRNCWDTFKALLERFGIKAKVVSEQWVKVGATDLTTNVAALNASKPDLIFTSLFLSDLPIFLRQASASGLRSIIASTVAGGQINDLRSSFVPEGTVLGHNTFFFALPGASELQKTFVSEYQARYKAVPTSSADRAYFNLMAYKAGVEKAAKATGRWPKTDEIAESIVGAEVESFGGRGRYRADKIAEQMFYQGLAKHQSDYPYPLLSDITVVFSDRLQKPAGADYWQWIKSADFRI
jgi:branched-chain amino acid transport system substrate-binding protein